MMYLILYPQNNTYGTVITILSSQRSLQNYQSVFTTDLDVVASSVKTPGVKVFRLDSLTEIKDIEVTYKEVTTETANE